MLGGDKRCPGTGCVSLGGGRRRSGKDGVRCWLAHVKIAESFVVVTRLFAPFQTVATMDATPDREKPR